MGIKHLICIEVYVTANYFDLEQSLVTCHISGSSQKHPGDIRKCCDAVLTASEMFFGLLEDLELEAVLHWILNSQPC